MNWNRTPAHVPVITTPLHRRHFDPRMNPPSAHSTRDLYDGSRKVSYETERVDQTQRDGEVSSSSQGPSSSYQPDDVERDDFAEENRMISRYLLERYNTDSKPQMISLNDNHNDYSMPGCSRDTADDSNSTIRRMITSKPYYLPIPMTIENILKEQSLQLAKLERQRIEEEAIRMVDEEERIEKKEEYNRYLSEGLRAQRELEELMSRKKLCSSCLDPINGQRLCSSCLDPIPPRRKFHILHQPILIKQEREDPPDENPNNNEYNNPPPNESVYSHEMPTPMKLEIEEPTEDLQIIEENPSGNNDPVVMPLPIIEQRDSTEKIVRKNSMKHVDVVMPRPIGEKRALSTDKSGTSNDGEHLLLPHQIKVERDDSAEYGIDGTAGEMSIFSNQAPTVPVAVKEEKEDFMQKLLHSNIEEKKNFPKGKLYKAEAMEGVDIDMPDTCDLNTGGPSGRTNSNASSIGSASSDSTRDISMPSTSNADKLLGLDKKNKKNDPKRSKVKNYGKCYEDDSDDELNEESWCTCLSSHEDDDDDEPEPEPELERHWRKRRNEPPPPPPAKKFCSPDSQVGNSSSEPWVTAGTSGTQPSTSQDPPEMKQWLNRFSSWTNSEKTQAIDALINRCAAGQVRHMMKAIEPLFQRDFISLLPKELALTVLGYLQPKDLLRAAQTCRYWRFLADDNLLWKEKCRRIGITTLKKVPRSLPRCASPWKTAYMRQYLIEDNWLHKSVNNPIVMRGHDDHVITCLQFSGNRILSGSDDTTLRVWSAVTGRCLRILVGHSGGVWSSQMVGHLVISGSTDRTLRVWNAKSGHCIKVLAGHTSTVRCMHLHDNRVVSGSRDATLRVWSLPDGRCLRVLVGHIAAVRCVQFDGKYVVSGAYDYFVKVWNPDTGECLHTLSGHTNRVYSLQFDGVHVVSGSLDTSIRVWEVETGQLKHTLTGHQSLTSGMELHSNTLVSGNADSTVKVWDITTGHCLHTLAGPNKHQSAVTCLQSSNRFVITSSDDGTVKLWDVRTGEFIRNLVELSSGGSGGVVWRIRASATKLVCAVGSRNGTEETKLLVLDFDIPGACRRCSE